MHSQTTSSRLDAIARDVGFRWMDAHMAAAAAKGWLLSFTTTSMHGPVQIQSFDCPEDDEEIVGFLPPELGDDRAAWRAVMGGNAAHHRVAMELVERHNPSEAKRVRKHAK